MLPRSLTARLVVTTVLLVAVAGVLIGGATALAVHTYLTRRLDQQVLDSVGRAVPGHHRGDGPGGHHDGPEPGEFGAQGPGTLIARPDAATGWVIAHRGADRQLDAAQLARLAAVPRDGRVHEVLLPGLGRFRVSAVSTSSGLLVTGLPTTDVDRAMSSLIEAELLLTTIGILAAGLSGLVIVRRQLGPLREVAATAHQVALTPLAEGEIDLRARVPERLTDERTEVGRVGASLNRLLTHVETALAARHRSELQVRQFVADASHELRTPLATIRGYAELAGSRPQDPAANRTAWEKVQVESGRMSSLVEDLLLLARLDSGRPLERCPVDLTRLLLEAVADAQVLAPGHHWRLELPEWAIEVTGDAARLHQVISNLLTNARKYTPAGTTVTVRAGARGLVVHDDGPGFPPEIIDGAFERFVRGDAARTREAGAGTGLGLALVKAIVVAHGGSVSLHTLPGDTSVTVRLPGLGQEAEAPAELSVTG